MQFQVKQTTAEGFKERGRRGGDATLSKYGMEHFKRMRDSRGKGGENKMIKNDDRIKKVRSMQAAVLERMMTPEEYEKLVNRYLDNRGQTGGYQREKFLKKPLSPSENNTLSQYFKLAPVRKLTETLGARVSRDIIARIALRWIFQNKEILDEALKGGESNVE